MADCAFKLGMACGRVPRFMHLRGHNHTAIVALLDSGEETLGPALLDFVRAGLATHLRVVIVASFERASIMRD